MGALRDHFDDVRPAADCLDLLTPPVADALRAWQGPVPVEQLLFVDTDPDKADTALFAETYGPELLDASATCVVVAGKRGGASHRAACVVRSVERVDVNGTVRRHLDVRKASFAPIETATSETFMEYGGITPIGLPAGWPVLVDPSVIGLPAVVLGSGRRRGKLIVPGKALADLPGAAVVEGLGR